VILDWRCTADYTPLARDAKGRARAKFERGRVVMREAHEVQGICFHITGAVFGAMPSDVKRHGRALAIQRRALKIPAHMTIFRDGACVVPFSLRAYLYHANALNDRTIGIEIERMTDASHMPQVQLDACHEGIDWLVRQAEAEGIHLRDAWGHRQSNGAKPGDPGPDVWGRIVVPASDRHGLVRTLVAVPRSTPKGRDGVPIPASWEP